MQPAASIPARVTCTTCSTPSHGWPSRSPRPPSTRVHAARLPADRGGRGPLRDLLTLVDEGGMIVACADPLLDEIEGLVRDSAGRPCTGTAVRPCWRGCGSYCWGIRPTKSPRPYPGITCKALFVAVPPGALAGPPEALTAGPRPGRGGLGRRPARVGRAHGSCRPCPLSGTRGGCRGAGTPGFTPTGAGSGRDGQKAWAPGLIPCKISPFSAEPKPCPESAKSPARSR